MRRQGRAPSVRALLAVAAVAVSICAFVATVLAVLDARHATTLDQITQGLGIIAAALFLGAGILRVSRWRIVGDERSLLMGTALVVLGGVALPLTSLAGVLMADADDSFLRAFTAVATTGVTIALVMWALTSRSSKVPRASRLLAGACGSALLMFLGLVAIHVWAIDLLHAGTLSPVALRGTILSVAWLYVGLEAALRSQERPWAGRVAPLLGCMGVAELLRVISAYHVGGWQLAGAALVAALAGVTAHRALMDLDEATTVEHEHFEAVSQALQLSHAGISEQNAWREEMVHDARNALAGLRAALMTLEKYDGSLDAPTSERLRSAALGEISHLEHLIIRPDRAESVDFDVADVVCNVVETQRANGVQVTVRAANHRAHGRPGDLATCLQNLLVNARDHGGNDVTLQTLSVAGRIEIYVADRGPGLSDGQLATLFQRGARGPSSRGSGLGLHVSRALMRQQGGDLQLRCHQGGAVFAVTLDQAATVAAPAPGRQRSLATITSLPLATHGRLAAGVNIT